MRAAVADVGAHEDQRGSVLDRHRGAGRLFEARQRQILAHVLNVPLVRLIAFPHVLRERLRGRSRELDLVVVVEDDQMPETEVSSERGRLGGDALLDIAVGCDHERVVIDDLVLVGVEAGGKHPFGQCEPN